MSSIKIVVEDKNIKIASKIYKKGPEKKEEKQKNQANYLFYFVTFTLSTFVGLNFFNK